MTAELLSWDHNVFFILNALAGTALGPVFAGLTWWGHAGVCLPVFCLTAYLSGKEKIGALDIRRLILFSIILSILVVVMKQGIQRPRPYLVLGSNEAYGHLGEILRHRSFPSGHTATALWVYLAAVGLALPSVIQRTCLVLAVLVGISRVVVGAHFPSDVLGAWLIGGATFVFIYANKRGSKGDNGHEPSKHIDQ